MSGVSIALSLLPGFAWLFFYLTEDPRPEPKRLLFKTFVFGAAFAFFTLAVQIILREMLLGYNLSRFAMISILALSEEIFKFAAAYASIRNEGDFDEPVDAMIYMVVASLGFATVENLGAIGGQPLTGIFFDEIFQTTTLRFLGATLLHTLSSAIIGYYWAISLTKPKGKPLVVAGFLLATALHAFFNYLILTIGSLVFPAIFVVSAGFFVLYDFEKLGQAKVNMGRFE